MTDYIKLAIIRREELNAEFATLNRFIKKADELSGVTPDITPWCPDRPSVIDALAPRPGMPAADRIHIDTSWDKGTWPIDETIGNETIEVETTPNLRPLRDEPKGTQYEQLEKIDKRILAMLAIVMIGIFGWYIWQAAGDYIWEYGERLFTNPVELVVPENVEPTKIWDGVHWQFTFKTKQGDVPIITIFDKLGAEADCKAVKKLTLDGVDPDDVVIESCHRVPAGLNKDMELK